MYGAERNSRVCLRGSPNRLAKKSLKAWLGDDKRLHKEPVVIETETSMNALFLLEASQSTGSVRLALDLRVNMAAVLIFFSRLF